MFLESMKEHFAKVRYEGMQEGERKGKLEIAQTMLVKGLEVNFIAEITGLSIGEIEQIENGRNH